MSPAMALRFFGTLAVLACVLTEPGRAAGSGDHAAPSRWLIKSASEVNGKLQIILRNGRVLALPRAADQCSFDAVAESPDGMSVGWVVGTTAQGVGDPVCAPGAQYVADGLLIWRAGKVIRRFSVWGGEINWAFIGKGDRVAVHAGPTHWDEEQAASLYDVATGRRLMDWGRSDKTPPPDWAANIIDNY